MKSFKQSLQYILPTLVAMNLFACSQAPLTPTPQARFAAQQNQNGAGLFNLPEGQLRRYQTPLQHSLSILNEAPDLRVAPIFNPEEPPAPLPAQPEQPNSGLPIKDPYTSPTAPTIPSAPGQPTEPLQPGFPNPEPQNPNTGTPGGTSPVPGGSYRYEDLQWFLRKIEAPRAWQISRGNPELTVAVIDTGLDYGHPAFAGRALLGYDFADNDMNPMDDQAHGTHVAGIIAGNDGNIQGVAPNVKILAIKVFSPDGFAKGEYVLARAIRYAVKYGASVINLSLGSPTLYDCDQYSDFMRALNSAIDEAYASGVNVVTAAGNEAYDFIYGRCSVQQNVNQIPVIATNELDRLAPFSNYPNFTHPKAISAPGVNIFSSIPRHLVCNEQYCEMPYDYMDGTSMAAPVIAGSLALIRSAMYQDYVRTMQRRQSQRRMQGPFLNFRDFFHEQSEVARQQLSLAVKPAQLAERILFSFTNRPAHVVPPGLIYEGRRDPIFGYGRTNVGAAVEAAANVFTAAGL